MFARVALKRCGHIAWCAAKGKKHRTAPADAIHTGAHHIFSMNNFDYGAQAEIFACRSRGASPRPVAYRRFDSGAEAIRYAMEELPAEVLFGTVLEVNEQRFDAAEIRRLYDSGAYPLQRRCTA